MDLLPPLDENDRPPSNAFPERRLSLRDWFPILLLVAGFIVDLLAGAFGKIGYVNSLFARWGALIGCVAMCLAALPVIRRTVANRRFLWMLFIGSALILVHQAFNLI